MKKYVPMTIVLKDAETGTVHEYGIAHFEQAVLIHDRDGKDGAERLRLDLWSRCDSYDDFESNKDFSSEHGK